jgi:hypothetical protein
MQFLRISAAALLVTASLCPALARADEAASRSDERPGGLHTQFELHASFLSDASDRSLLQDTFGYAGRIGWRWDSFGIFLQGEQNLWDTREFERSIVQGALNLGLGAELLYFEQRARSSVAFGPSILLFDSGLDDAGSTGIFVDVRPVGLRWQFSDRVGLQVDPLTFTVVAPVLEGIPLVMVEYRTVLGLEFDLIKSRREPPEGR